MKFVENNLELELEYFVKCQNQIVRYMPGGQVAGYQKKLLSMHATAYITVHGGGEQ